MEVNDFVFERLQLLVDNEKLTGLQFFKKLYNNANLYYCYNSSLNEKSKLFEKLEDPNLKLNMQSHSREIDNLLVFIFIKSLMTIPSTTKAYKLGLINSDGQLIREPETPEENDSISNLDLLMGKLRMWLKHKLSFFSSSSWIRNANGNMRLQNALSNAKTTSMLYSVKKINSELSKILDHT